MMKSMLRLISFPPKTLSSSHIYALTITEVQRQTHLGAQLNPVMQNPIIKQFLSHQVELKAGKEIIINS